MKVLMIDDSEMALEFQQMLLERSGLEVRACLDIEEVTEALTDYRPDVVLTDVNMPDIETDELCQWLRAQEVLEGVPVMLCSGMEADQLKVIAEKCGVEGYVSKADGLRSLPQQLKELVEKA